MATLAHCQLCLAMAQEQLIQSRQGWHHMGKVQCPMQCSCCLACHRVHLWLQLLAPPVLASPEGILVRPAASRNQSTHKVGGPNMQFTNASERLVTTMMARLLRSPATVSAMLIAASFVPFIHTMPHA